MKPIFLALLCAGCTARPVVLDESRLVDLTYPFNEDTIYGPPMPPPLSR